MYCDSWAYPPVRLEDGTELTGNQVKLVVRWYRERGQMDEDDGGLCECEFGQCQSQCQERLEEAR
jgi:hypothetical protein